MTDFNPDRIRQLSGEIRNALRKLTTAAEVGEADFLGSPAIIDAVKYNLIVAIEGAIDICRGACPRGENRDRGLPDRLQPGRGGPHLRRRIPHHPGRGEGGERRPAAASQIPIGRAMKPANDGRAGLKPKRSAKS